MAASTEMGVEQLTLAILLGPDPSPFDSLISHLMSAGNEARSQAEHFFNACRTQHPDTLLLKLLYTLHFSSPPEIRCMAALLLRKQLTLWRHLQLHTHTSIKNQLLACVQREEGKSVMRQLCDTVSELAATIAEDGEWIELLPFLFQSVSSASNRLKESALLIFGQLAQYMDSQLHPHLPTLHAVFQQTLASSMDGDVRIAALRATSSFIQTLDSARDRECFQDLLPATMQTLTHALDNYEEAVAQEALEMFIEIAGTEPRFFRKHLVEVVSSMLQIADTENLEEATRHLAVEFLITLAEASERAPGMMRKLPQFIGKLFSILMKMLLDIEDDFQWHKAESENENATESSNYDVGQECLDRLANSLGGNTILPVASDLLAAYISDQDWRKRHTALITLAQIAEGCSKVMTKSLEPVVTMVLSAFSDPHPRVRWAAINAIGQLSTALGPDLQEQHHLQVLPALVSAMDDFRNPRVQAHAAAAILNFCESCTSEILTPYLDCVVGKLLVLLQNGQRMVQEGALTALASVADAVQEKFGLYYDLVMPFLKTILINATDKPNRMLRAKSMECISLVGMAVGKEKFRQDANQVMEVLMSLQGAPLEDDDPTISYMIQAWARLCKGLGAEFLPYMRIVMPPLLHLHSLNQML